MVQSVQYWQESREHNEDEDSGKSPDCPTWKNWQM